MESIEVAKQYLDETAGVSIWYAEYEGRDEAIQYANNCFCETFGMSVEEILEKKKNHLVNPPGTTNEVIERYKNEDLTAIKEGLFLNRSPIESGKDIEVVKIRFDQGVLGLFKFVDAGSGPGKIVLRDLDVEILSVVRGIRPDLLE